MPAQRQMALVVLSSLTLSIGFGQGKITVQKLTPVVAGNKAVIVVKYALGNNLLRPGGRISIQLPPFWESPEPYLNPPYPENQSDSGSTTSSSAAPRATVSVTDPNAIFGLSLGRVAVDGTNSVTSVSVIHIDLLGSTTLGFEDTITVRFGDFPETDRGIRVSRFGGQARFVGTEYQLEYARYVFISLDEQSIEVDARAVRKIRVTAPSIVFAGVPFTVRASFADEFGNRNKSFNQDVALYNGSGTEQVRAAAREGFLEVPFVMTEFHPDSIILQAPNGLAGVSNPIVVSESTSTRIWWGDPHTHSHYSSHGRGYPEDLVDFAKRSSLLDWVIYTEHDWVIPDHSAIASAVLNQANAPDSFVTLQGLEWTSRTSRGNAYGHMTVVSKNPQPVNLRADVHQTLPSAFRVAAAEGNMLMVNHPMGPFWFSWTDFDSTIVRNVEMVSDSWTGLRSNEVSVSTVPGLPVNEIVKRNYVLGFTGVSDNHYSQPGVQSSDYTKSSGLTAVISRRLTREEIFDGLRLRHNYATTGARIILQVKSGRYSMGDVIPYLELKDKQIIISVEILGTSRLRSVDVIKNGSYYSTLPVGLGAHLRDFFEDSVDTLPVSYYVRVTQTDGEMAWSSPIWVRDLERERISWLQDSPSGSRRRLWSNPNPASGVIRFTVLVDQPGRAILRIYDVLGREIQTVWDVEGAAQGLHTIYWSGETLRGFRAATGTYIVRFDGPGYSETKRIVFIR